jgi:hypothetical protein
VPYTVWSKDRLLGHSDLGYVQIFPKHLMGDFHPTELGDQLMPVLTGVSRAYKDLANSSRERWSRSADHDTPKEQRSSELRATTEYADAAEAAVHLDALDLVLRGPDGSIVPTEWIGVRDTELYAAEVEAFENDLEDIDPILGDEADIELLRSVQHDMEILDAMSEAESAQGSAYEWEERASPRYQLQVGLVGESDSVLEES